MLAGVPSKPVRARNHNRNRNIPVSNVELKQIKALDCPYEFSLEFAVSFAGRHPDNLKHKIA